uniref:Uncharacterized protein n=1 Tax=Anguilla anguilla TaxID=7936 RepID=A0A0E9TSH1_ANGAN
MQDTSHPVLVC